MTKKIVPIATVICLLFASCHNTPKPDSGSNKIAAAEKVNDSTTTDIAFTVAKNYFVNNTVTTLANPKIETFEKFNEIFGMATTMAKDGKPTEIDFTKQYVIAVILPQTDLMTTIDSISLQKNVKNEITLTYKSVVGQKQTFTTRPNLAIIVNKVENGIILLKDKK